MKRSILSKIRENPNIKMKKQTHFSSVNETQTIHQYILSFPAKLLKQLLITIGTDALPATES